MAILGAGRAEICSSHPRCLNDRNDALKKTMRKRVHAKSSFRALRWEGSQQVCKSGKMERGEEQ